LGFSYLKASATIFILEIALDGMFEVEFLGSIFYKPRIFYDKNAGLLEGGESHKLPLTFLA